MPRPTRGQGEDATVNVYHDARISRLEELLEKMTEEQKEHRGLVEETIRRTDIYAEQMQTQGEELKDIKKEQIDVGKVLATMALRFAIIQWAAAIIGAFLLYYLLSHVFK